MSSDQIVHSKYPPHLHQTTLTHPKYRPDIDGLRAIAVISIVCFHAFPAWITGGFIGVDIFFVISGFLISTIIFENLFANRFSFLEFYGRRIKRIFPALILVLLVSMMLGWATLFSDEYKQLGKHTVGGAGFISNLLFWGESGYFDNSSDTKPLLHLWSLGIEEQFYILWPLFLWVGWKFRQNLLLLTVSLGLISFSLNIQMTGTDPVAAFFFPHTRFWEMLAGSLLALLKIRSSSNTNTPLRNSALSNCFSLIGICCIFAGLTLIDKKDIFPGWLALLPITGTTLIIAASPNCWLNRELLSNKLLVWFGLISFPLYLWHWPILTFMRIVKGEHPTPFEATVALVVSTLLAWLTYSLIEKPIRSSVSSHKYLTDRVKVLSLVALMVFTASAGLFCYLQNGLPSRKVVINQLTLDTGLDGGALGFLENECGVVDKEDKKLLPICNSDSRGVPRYALLGDSKGSALYRGLIRTSTEDGRWLAICGNGPHGAPAPIVSQRKMYQQYQELAAIGLEAIVNNPDIEKAVFVTAARVLFRIGNSHSLETLPTSKHYKAALEGMGNAARHVIAAGKEVVLVVDNPTLPEPRDCLNRKTSLGWLNALLPIGENEKCSLELKRHQHLTEQYQKLLSEVQSQAPNNISIFDTTQYLCDMDAGLCQISRNGRMLYSYSDHVSDYAAGLIGKGLNEFLNKN